MSKSICWTGLACLGLILTGCRSTNHTDRGTAIGAGAGAVGGALIGEASGHPVLGAVVGGVTGAVVGNMAGSAADAREERDLAVARSQYAYSVAQAVTASDVIAMTHAGMDDALIINSINTRGCRWDGSPQTMITLKQQGVSDQVIASMQSAGLQPAAAYIGSVPPLGDYEPVPVVRGGVMIMGPPPPRPWFRPHYHMGHSYYRRW